MTGWSTVPVTAFADFQAIPALLRIAEADPGSVGERWANELRAMRASLDHVEDGPAPRYRIHPEGWCVILVATALRASAAAALTAKVLIYSWGWGSFAVLAACLWLSFRADSRQGAIRSHRVFLAVGVAFGVAPLIELALNETMSGADVKEDGPMVAAVLRTVEVSSRTDDVYVVVPDRFPSPAAAESAGRGYSNLGILGHWVVDRRARTETPSTKKRSGRLRRCRQRKAKRRFAPPRCSARRGRRA